MLYNFYIQHFMAYRLVSLIDLYLHTKFHRNQKNFLWTDGQTYRWADVRDGHLRPTLLVRLFGVYLKRPKLMYNWMKCFSFWGLSPPDPLLRLCPWNPLGDFCLQTPWRTNHSPKIVDPLLTPPLHTFVFPLNYWRLDKTLLNVMTFSWLCGELTVMWRVDCIVERWHFSCGELCVPLPLAAWRVGSVASCL